LRHIYKSLILLAVLSLVSACVTQRKKDEAKGLKLFFHNLTAKYNGFFNAEVLVKDATEKLTAMHQDNFNKVLDVYPDLAVESYQSVIPDLDKAIEKAAVAATFHRPSHWTDDSYLLLGKAQYLKHDFQGAEESFQYLTDVYDPSLKRKLSPKDRKKAADEARKEKLEARKEASAQAKKDREDKQKAQKEAAAQAKKDKEEKAKQEAIELENRTKLRQDSVENAQKERKTTAQKESLDRNARNEARRKANEERAEANRKKREEEKKRGNRKIEDKEEEERIAEARKKQIKPKEEEPKETGKVEIVKTGINETPVFKTDETVKLGRKKGKPDRYFLKHRPCHQEGVVWLARTHTERGNYVEAEILLETLEKSPKTFKDIRQQVAVAKAHLQLKQQNYAASIPALETAVKLTKKKRERARLAYILAQVYQLSGSGDKAYAMFDKVLKYNPLYEMEFNARLNMSLNSTTSVENTTAMLKKMGKDAKNREYNDQIYFALAQIALKNKQDAEAFEYLRQAIGIGSKNKLQTAEIYYLLAKLEYEKEKYVDAKRHYDSTLLVMDKNDARKPEVERYAENLVEISKNIEIITLQDSLVKISALSDREKRDVASAIKKARIKAAEAAVLASTPKPTGGISAEAPQTGSVKSSFFAYSQDAIKKGKREFDKKWGGDRKLQDHWRRSNKKGISGDGSNVEIASNDISEKEVKEILKDVPKTPAEIEERKTQIDDALFNLGTLYHDKLKNDKKAVETLEQDLSRFPTTKHELEDWYYLYLAHSDLANKTKAAEYYDKLQQKYPTSQYAQILKNPDAGKKKDEQSAERYYTNTYTLFQKGEYKQVTERIAESETTYGINNPMKAKFALLNAMSIGNLQGKQAYINLLKEVIAKYNGTPEEKRAQEILRILEFAASGGTVETGQNSEAINEKYKLDDNSFHYILIVLTKDANMEDCKAAVSDYNARFHRLDDLKIAPIYFSAESEIPVIVVRRFKDKTAGLQYTTGVVTNEKDFIIGTKYEVFTTTVENYRTILKEQSIKDYRAFYQKHYTK
jgi:tetratricopeptide (TPR) repeat protein